MSEEKNKFRVKEAYIVDEKEGELRKIILEVREVENHPPLTPAECTAGMLLSVVFFVLLFFFIRFCIWIVLEVQDWFATTFYRYWK